MSEFPDVFPKDLPGMPPEQKVEFAIELLPGTAPIFKRAYTRGRGTVHPQSQGVALCTPPP